MIWANSEHYCSSFEAIVAVEFVMVLDILLARSTSKRVLVLV